MLEAPPPERKPVEAPVYYASPKDRKAPKPLKKDGPVRQEAAHRAHGSFPS